jgi:hypothetical protein
VGQHGLQLDERRLGARMVDPPITQIRFSRALNRDSGPTGGLRESSEIR